MTTETIRVQKADGGWLPLPCSVVADRSGTLLKVPGWGTWAICPSGMIGNIGGNDWRIYTLNGEDCARLCALAKE